MTNREIDKRIRTAVEHAAPHQLERILSSCDQTDQTTEAPQRLMTGAQKKGAVIPMTEIRNEKPRRKRSGLAAIAAVAAAFVLMFGAYTLTRQNTDPEIDSIIMLDVNPSLTLYVDAEEIVQSVDALNDEARDVMGTMDLKGTSLEVTVNALIGSMMQKGYLGDLQNSILVSVENKDAARGAQLQQKVSQAISSAMHTDTMDAAVLSQTVDGSDEALAQLAQTHNISMGKAALIQEVIAQDATLTFEALVPMSINEIALIASSKQMTSQSVTQTGTASEKAYIGKEQALDAAYAHAGITAADAKRVHVEFDSDDGRMVYEVEFETTDMEYEYDIDARTGEVVTHEAESRYEDRGTNDNANTDTNTFIGEEAAKNAALTHAGVNVNDVIYIHCNIDYDDGIPENYDVEFVAGDMEYDYEIDLYSGAVWTSDREYLDDRYEDSYQGSESHTDPSSQSQQTGTSTEETQPSGNTGTTPSTDNTSYIGRDAALAAVLAHAGITESDLTQKEIELDEDDGRMIYEVNLEVGPMEYEYEVNALTGQILKAEKDMDD